ncbi:MAG: hypothetical protein AAF393_16635 [Pseudomonadota bacterium]
MKESTPILLAIFCAAGLFSTPALAKSYKCKVQVGGTQWTVNFSKSNVSAAGGSFKGKQVGPKALRVTAYGEVWTMHPKGKIVGRQGGKHRCDMGKVISAFSGG